MLYTLCDLKRSPYLSPAKQWLPGLAMGLGGIYPAPGASGFSRTAREEPGQCLARFRSPKAPLQAGSNIIEKQSNDQSNASENRICAQGTSESRQLAFQIRDRNWSGNSKRQMRDPEPRVS